MGSGRARFVHSGGNLLFVAVLWIAMATALLCALLPVGLPLTKTVGSAFSPATSAVALRAAAPRLAAKCLVKKSDGGSATDLAPPSGKPDILAPCAQAALTLPIYLQRPFSAFGCEFAIFQSPEGACYPRGPPIA